MQSIDALRRCTRFFGQASRYGGLLAALVFATAILGVGALRRDYRHATQLVSELGETGGEYAWLFNRVGFLPTGVLVLLFAVHLRKWLRERELPVTAAVLVAIHGLGMVAAAWVSCDVSCHPASPTPMQLGHDVIAAIKFPALIAATFVLARHLRRDPVLRWLARLSSVAGFASLILMVGFSATVESRMATGLLQRAFLTTIYAWLSVLSVSLGALPVQKSPGAVSAIA